MTTFEDAIKEIDIRMLAVAAERDKIDSLIDELRHLSWNCEDAHDNLQRARDALSEIV